MTQSFLVDTGYACGGITFNDNDICIEAAVIFDWMIGKHKKEIAKWKKIKNIEACEVKDAPD